MARAILIADDSEHDRLFLERILNQVGLKNPFFFVRDGAEALEYLKGEGEFGDREKFPAPAVLFLDLKMPRVYGQEVLRWVKEQPELLGLMIFVVSHFNDATTYAEVYALGAKSFLAKPVKVADVINLIESFPGVWERAGGV